MSLTKIMYIEYKGGNLIGEARIGKVIFSKSRRSVHYKEKTFLSLSGRGFKSNFIDLETREEYWISGCKKNGEDRLYGERLPIYIDDDVREEYWVKIRHMPENINLTRIN